MKKSVELRKEYEELKNSIAALKAENKLEEAYAKLTDLKDLENKIREAEIEETMNAGAGGKKEMKNKETMNVNRLFNRLIMGKSLNAEEIEFLNQAGTPGQVEATDGKGGYLVPTEQYNQIVEYKRELVSLEKYCHVIPVNSPKGVMPVESGDIGELVSFEELNEITQKDVDFKQIAYKTGDYGVVIPFSNTLLEDEKANLMDYVGRIVAKKSVNTKNKKIIALLKTLSPVQANDYTGIIDALNVTLDPAISAGAIILTNQTGFNYLDKLTDKQNRPLLEIDLQNATKKLFKGREIVVVSDALLPMNTTKAPVFVGMLGEFVKVFDRKNLEVALSMEAGFTKNATLLRAIERFGIEKADEKAVAYLELKTA